MKKKRHEHVNHERWLVSYADFITLLFAFFVVLYSSAQVDKRKAGQLSAAIQVAFEDLGVFQGAHPGLTTRSKDQGPVEEASLADDRSEVKVLEIPESIKDMLAITTEAQSLQDAKRSIEKVLGPEIQRNEVSLSTRREGLVISLREIGFFDSGSATIRPASLDALERLATVLKQRNEDLRIEGHTDNVPIHNSRFDSNWELSTSRATEMISLLINQFGFVPIRLSAAGYGQFHPIAPNDTPSGRAQNRRLDVVILASPQAGR